MRCFTQIKSLISYFNKTITSVLSNKNNLTCCIFLSGKSFNMSFDFFKRDLTWLIIIDNGHSCSSIFTFKVITSVWIFQLNMEILIWFPVIVILNSNVECKGTLSLRELKYTLESNIILSSFSITINGRDIDGSSLFRLILNNNCQFSG